MKFLFISGKGRCLPIAYRIQEEGVEVAVYIHHPRYMELYEGLIKERLVDVSDLAAMLEKVDPDRTIIFDGNMLVEPEGGNDELRARDAGIFKIRQVGITKSERLFGPLASDLRMAGWRKVIGGSAQTEKTELDRNRTKKLAKHGGMSVPRSQNCATRADALSFLSSNKRHLWIMHPIYASPYDAKWTETIEGELLDKLTGPWGDSFPKDLPIVLEKRVPGITYHEGVWWDGDRFLRLHGSIEDRYTDSDGRGQLVESMLTATWLKGKGQVPWESLRGWVSGTRYLGPITFRMQVDVDRKAWVTGCSFGLRYDSIFGLVSLMRCEISRFFGEMFHGGFNDVCVAATARAYLRPYPSGTLEECQGKIAGASVRADLSDFYAVDVHGGARGLEVAGTDGFLGVGVARDSTDRLEPIFHSALRQIAGVASGVNFKSDLAGVTETWETVKELGLQNSGL